jgi:translocation and assembly module TamB
MTKMRLGLVLLPALAALMVLAWVGFGTGVRAQSETTILGDLISRALSTPTTRVSIGAVDGALSSDATIRNVAISDRDGVWLRLDRARIIWRRLALLSGRLEIDRLEIGHLEYLRPAIDTGESQVVSDQPILPELPVRVEVEAFSLNELTLGEPVLGTAARLGANGTARLGRPSEGLSLTLTARRLDAPGRFDVRLAFVPQGERLDLAAEFEEPEGGLVARVASLPGLPPVRLDLKGTGVLDDWRAGLTFVAGPEIGATGQARLVRQDTARRLTLDLTAQVEGLLPAPAAPVFAGTTALRGAMTFGDSGALGIESFDLTSRTARLSVAGSLSADRLLDVAAQIRTLPTEGQVTRAAGGEVESFTFDGKATGPVLSPRITGRLAASGVRVPQGNLNELSADLSVEPEPTDQTRFTVRADARAGGLELADAALRRAVGSEAELTLRGTFGTDGVGRVETLRLANGNADIRYEGQLGANVIDGRLQADLRRLDAFSTLADRRLRGSLAASVKLDGNPAQGAVRADIDARGSGLSLGQPALDRLLGGRLGVRGVARTLPDGYGFEDLRIAGAFVDGRIDGSATQAAANVNARLRLPDLAKAHSGLAGRAELAAQLSGSLARPDLTATLTTVEARALGRPLRDVRADAVLRDVTGLLDGNLTISGAIGNEPLRGSVQLRRSADLAWTLDPLDLHVGSASITGRANLDPANRAEGVIRIAAPDLDDLSPLVLTRLDGALDATLTLSRPAGHQDVHVQARGNSVRVPDVASLAGLDVDLRASDILGAPMIDGRAVVDSVEAGGETFEEVRLVAQGSAAASDLSLQARAQGFSLTSEATLIPGDRLRLEIARLSAERGRERLALVQPAALVFDADSVEIANLVVAAGTGRIAISGRAGLQSDLTVDIRAVPLSVANVMRPDLSLAGTLDADAVIRGSLSEPDGRYSLRLARFSVPQTRDAGLPPIGVDAKGTLADGAATVDARVSAGPGMQLSIDGSVPLTPEGAIRLALRGRIDAALANTMLSTSGQRIAGRLDIDARVSGSVGEPRVEGGATLSGGSFTDSLQGIRLMGIEGRLVGRGDEIVFERLTARTRNGGTLSVSGRVTPDVAAGLPGSLRITANRAELVANDIVAATSNLDLTLEGPLIRTPRIAGRVEIISMNVSIPDRLPQTIRPLPGTRHIDAPPRTRAHLAALRRQQAARGSGPAFEAELDLTLAAPNRIFVRGRGVDAELGGDLRLTGTSRDPVAIGAFELRRGRFSILGQRLDFTHGRLTFTGDLAPGLDFAAETQAGDVTARIVISGTAAEPAFELTSEPQLPQDEVLSRILFQKASGSLSGFQALQLAQAAAQLAGSGSGSDIFEQTRRALGVDSLDITTGAKGGPALSASRYIGDRVSIGVRAGARPEDSAATVTIDVTRRLKVRGEMGADGGSSVGVGAEWEY